MRSSARRILGSKKRVRKVNRKSGGTKIKLKIKSKTPEGVANAVNKLARGIMSEK